MTGDRVTVITTLNDRRYLGRPGTIEQHYSHKGVSRTVVKLDEWRPGLETPDGRLYLYDTEYVIEGSAGAVWN